MYDPEIYDSSGKSKGIRGNVGSMDIPGPCKQPVPSSRPRRRTNGLRNKRSIGADSAASEPFDESTAYVILSADEACSIAWTVAGADTNDATTANARLPANTPRWFGVAGGMTVSVVTNS
jgi:hypothetical protein